MLCWRVLKAGFYGDRGWDADADADGWMEGDGLMAEAHRVKSTKGRGGGGGGDGVCFCACVLARPPGMRRGRGLEDKRGRGLEASNSIEECRHICPPMSPISQQFRYPLPYGDHPLENEKPFGRKTKRSEEFIALKISNSALKAVRALTHMLQTKIIGRLLTHWLTDRWFVPVFVFLGKKG